MSVVAQQRAADVRANWSAHRTARRKASGYVYFVRCEQFVKIGYSSLPGGRAADFSTGNPFPCITLGTIHGGLDREKELHKQFAAWRHTGEWFRFDPEVADAIALLLGHQ